MTEINYRVVFEMLRKLNGRNPTLIIFLGENVLLPNRGEITSINR